MKLRPLRDFLVVRLLPEPKPAGLIVAVALSQKPSVHAEVLAVGSEVRDIQVGQKVIVSRLQGTLIELDEPVILMRESAVLGTL